MSPTDQCGPAPNAEDYGTYTIDANGARINQPLTAAQDAQYLADLAVHMTCLAQAQGLPACPAGQYFIGNLTEGVYSGQCYDMTTWQPVSAPFSVAASTTPGVQPAIPTTPAPSTTPATTTPPVTTTPPATTAPAASGTSTTPTPSSSTPATPKDTLGFEFGGGDDYCSFNPDDPFCQFGQTLGSIFQQLGQGPATNVVSVVQETGLLASDVHDIVDSALSSMWQVVVTAVDTIIASAISGIQNAITDIGNALKAAWDILTRLSGLILKFLGQLWYGLLHALVLAVQDVFNLLKGIYDDVLKPMLGLLQQIRQKLLDLWKRFIVPLLVILQDIRRVLNILAIFHVKFAQKLDQKLAELEAKITQPLLLVLGMVNGVANWINLLVTANYLIQKPIFLWSLQAYVGESVNLQLNAMNKPISSGDVAAANAAAAFPSSTTSQDDLLQFLTSQNGGLADTIAAQSAQLQQYLNSGL